MKYNYYSRVGYIQTIFLKNPTKYLKVNNWWYSDFASKAHYMLPLSDIALINLPDQHKINFDKVNAEPVYLFSPNYLYKNIKNFYSEFKAYEPKAKTALVVGWGYTKFDYRTRHKQRADVLSKGIMRTHTALECEKQTRRMNYHKNTMGLPDVFCGTGIKITKTRDRGSKTKSTDRYPTKPPPQICMGDSGGPIFFKFRKSLVQFGISVWVDEFCSANFNGFLKIDSHINWIIENAEEKEAIKILATRGNKIGETLVVVSLDENGYDGFEEEYEYDKNNEKELASEDDRIDEDNLNSNTIYDWISNNYPKPVADCLKISDPYRNSTNTFSKCHGILKSHGLDIFSGFDESPMVGQLHSGGRKITFKDTSMYRNEKLFAEDVDFEEIKHDVWFWGCEMQMYILSFIFTNNLIYCRYIFQNHSQNFSLHFLPTQIALSLNQILIQTTIQITEISMPIPATQYITTMKT